MIGLGADEKGDFEESILGDYGQRDKNYIIFHRKQQVWHFFQGLFYSPIVKANSVSHCVLKIIWALYKHKCT